GRLAQRGSVVIEHAFQGSWSRPGLSVALEALATEAVGRFAQRASERAEVVRREHPFGNEGQLEEEHVPALSQLLEGAKPGEHARGVRDVEDGHTLDHLGM